MHQTKALAHKNTSTKNKQATKNQQTRTPISKNTSPQKHQAADTPAQQNTTPQKQLCQTEPFRTPGRSNSIAKSGCIVKQRQNCAHQRPLEPNTGTVRRNVSAGPQLSSLLLCGNAPRMMARSQQIALVPHEPLWPCPAGHGQ